MYDVKDTSGQIHKVTEWVEGRTIHEEMESNPDMIEVICTDLARYVNVLYDADGITAVDSHFKNFVWAGNEVVYIDLKKLMIRPEKEAHLFQMTKICLKGCRGDRRKVFAFLKGYSNYRAIDPILEECNKLNWQWFSIKTEPIKMEEILDE